MMISAWKTLTSSSRRADEAGRRAQRLALGYYDLERRKVLSHAGMHHPVRPALPPPAMTAPPPPAAPPAPPVAMAGGAGSALQQLRADVLAIEAKSVTTVAELTAIRSSLDALRADGLPAPTPSALGTFEDGLVKAYAAGDALAGDSALLASFEALYATAPTAAQANDLAAAYDALAAAVTSSNITAADLATIDADASAARGGTGHDASYPYFGLVLGREVGPLPGMPGLITPPPGGAGVAGPLPGMPGPGGPARGGTR